MLALQEPQLTPQSTLELGNTSELFGVGLQKQALIALQGSAPGHGLLQKLA